MYRTFEDILINLHLTKQCNYACGHCMYASGPQSPGTYMDYRVFEWLQDCIPDSESRDHSSVTVNLVGGEPTLNMREFEWRFQQLVRIAKDRELMWEMTTNGWWAEDPKLLLWFVKIVAEESACSDFLIRVSSSPWHDEFRSPELAAFWKYGPNLKAILEQLYDYGEDVYKYEHPLSYKGVENIYVNRTYDVGMDPLSKISATGRGLKLGGYQDPTCYSKGYETDQCKLTILPDGTMRDFCCNGGALLRLGKVWDRSFEEWLDLARDLYTHHKQTGTNCAQCGVQTLRWKDGIKARSILKQYELESILH